VYGDLPFKGIGEEGEGFDFRLWEMHSMFLLSGNLFGRSHRH
jgi:hypothetical protein